MDWEYKEETGREPVTVKSASSEPETERVTKKTVTLADWALRKRKKAVLAVI